MRTEIHDGGNVVRFPIERRPTFDLLHDLALDAREVLALADTFELAVAPDIEEQADRAAAEYILNAVPADGPARAAMLREMASRAVTAAIVACRRGYAARRSAAEAQQRAAAAGPAEGYLALDLEHQAVDAAVAAAEALVAAYARTYEAFGIRRAVDLARRGEPWTPRDVEAEWEALLLANRRTA